MIPKVSCCNQNFTSAGLASSRACATGARIASNQIERAASRFNQHASHPVLSDETCLGSLIGAAAAIVLTFATKSGAGAYAIMHSLGMIGGGVIGKKVHAHRNTLR